MTYARNDYLENRMLPVDIVLHPSWWYHHEGITFDEDFFFHPARRVEVERTMEKALHQRWGRFGLGADHDKDLPVVGPVHLAAGYQMHVLFAAIILSGVVSHAPASVRYHSIFHGRQIDRL